MDNPEDLVRTLEGQVERLKVIFNEATSALTDDLTEVSQFCVSLECCLRHHQKEKLSFWGDRRDYWNYLSEGVSHMKTLESLVKLVQAQAHLTTSQGRGRGLIRLCLVDHQLADLIQTAISNSKRTKDGYHSSSVLQSPSHSERLISALYDLSEVDFDLPSEGVDLDETWPSFVLKSFQSSDTRHTLFGTLSPAPKEAMAASKTSPDQRRMLLERGVEEEASEIYVKQEIPFSINLVSNLLDDIRCNLVGQSETIGGQTHLCPELEVVKLDDITSCLTVLRDYITTWSRDVTKNSRTIREEMRQAKVRLADVEMQLQATMSESEGVETSLLNQLQDTRDDLQACSGQIQELIDDNMSFKSHLSFNRSKISELETLNFSLEEQLMEAQEGEAVDGGGVEEERRGRSHTLIETALQERDQSIQELSLELQERDVQLQATRTELASARHTLHTLSPLPALLQQQVVAETEAKAAMYLSQQNLQSKYSELEHRYQQSVCEVEQLRGSGQEAELRERCETLATENARLTQELDELRTKLAGELEQVRREEGERRVSLEREVERLTGDCGVVRDEVSALRYQLSSSTMELQQMKELLSEKERALTSLHGKSSGQEQLLREARERQRVAQDEAEELRRELIDVESVLGTHEVEMNSLNEQLTEKTHSRDKERAELLKVHNSLDGMQAQLATEKQDFAKEVSRLTEENNDIRRAFRRLLQQKVTLWQHADELEQEQLQQGTWINSKHVTECMECATPFSLLSRKHHCRSCGKVYCSKCCEQKIQLPFSKGPVRVCVKCHQKISQMRTPFVSKLINSDVETLDASLEDIRKTSSNSLNLERSQDTAGNSLQAKLRVQNADDDSSVSSSFNDRWLKMNGSAPTVDGESTMSFEGSGNFETVPTSILRPPSSKGEARGSVGSLSLGEYSVDPETKRRESVRSSSQQADHSEGATEEVHYHIATVEGDSLDESYYLIDAHPQFPVGLDVPGNRFLDVNALASRLASLEVTQAQRVEGRGAESPSPGATGGATAAAPPGDSQGRKSSSFTEISLGGGEAHTVTVVVEKKGTAVAWEFMSEPKGLAFGLSYQEDVPGGRSQEILPLRRCVSHKAALTGEYVAQKAGNYILRFDNCHSKYSGRRLQYKHWVKLPV